ncbi:MAG: hypothetical protein AB7N71_13860, partial [Phycisphaerae bacterium]
MAIFKQKKRTARQEDIRRSRAERGLTWKTWLPTRLPFLPMLIALTLGIIAAVLVTFGPDPLPYSVGQRVSRPV